jgi:pilus assembly protein CpaE
LILNRLGRPGGLTRKQIEDALNAKIDITVPDMPKPLGESAHQGDAMRRLRGPFQHMIDDLAREIGFVGKSGQDSAHSASAFSLTGFVRRLLPQNG